MEPTSMKKFLDSLTDEQKRSLGIFIQYEGLNMWLLSVIIGSRLTGAVAYRRACRKYRNVVRFHEDLEKLNE